MGPAYLPTDLREQRKGQKEHMRGKTERSAVKCCVGDKTRPLSSCIPCSCGYSHKLRPSRPVCIPVGSSNGHSEPHNNKTKITKKQNPRRRHEEQWWEEAMLRGFQSSEGVDRITVYMDELSKRKEFLQ